MYGVTRFLALSGLVLLGMVIGGDAHQAASIVSHVGNAASHHILFTAIILIPIGMWHAHERAVHNFGAYEMETLRNKIEKGGTPYSKR